MDAGHIAQSWAGRAEPVLQSSSLSRTMSFWQALGFGVELWHEDEGYAWVTLGGIRIDYNLIEDLDPFSTTGTAYVTVADVAAVYDIIIAAGVAEPLLDGEGLFLRSMEELHNQWRLGNSLARVSRPITQSWDKLEVALFDPDNNLIRIGSPLT